MTLVGNNTETIIYLESIARLKQNLSVNVDSLGLHH